MKLLDQFQGWLASKGVTMLRSPVRDSIILRRGGAKVEIDGIALRDDSALQTAIQAAFRHLLVREKEEDMGLYAQAFPNGMLQAINGTVGGMLSNITTTDTFNSTGMSNTYTVDYRQYHVVPTKIEPPAPKRTLSALEWLDQRIAEVCVAL